MFLLQIYFLIIITINVYKDINTKHWPSVMGKIMSSTIKEDYNYIVNGDTNEKGTGYYYEITYNYSINDKIYTGTNIDRYGYKTSIKKNILEIVEKYYIGLDVIVYYNPTNPGDSLLEPGIKEVIIITMSFLVLSITIFIIVFLKKLNDPK